jgi:hypothetical protein
VFNRKIFTTALIVSAFALPGTALGQFQDPSAPVTDQYPTTGTTSGTAGTTVTGTAGTTAGGGVLPGGGGNNPTTGTTGTTATTGTTSSTGTTTGDAGGGQGPDTGSGNVNPNTVSSVGGSGKSLPFTGVDLLLLVLIGLILLAAGTLLRAALRVRKSDGLTRFAR